jgi:hypothetical protein
MNKILSSTLIALTSTALVSSTGIDPRLSYQWNNCANATVRITAAGLWDDIESYIGQPTESCTIWVSVDFYDYDTFLKVIETTGSIQTTKYYSTNIYGYIIIEGN